MSSSFTTLERIVEEYATELRERLAANNHDYLYFNITVSGPTLHGELAVTYNFGYAHEATYVSSGNLSAAETEYEHRLGFAKRHQAKCLPRVKPRDGDDIPF